eukprot:TRINITY_DN6153_c1_g1_i2.p2 TRINITY_DN6153_c1_g1~~TRINITY_DN6153_c1_g1_i2.p2  ORF type:complete len:233 (+),score=28.17 TRINITY_DN6153_c1_g1_i2:36-734(+)
MCSVNELNPELLNNIEKSLDIVYKSLEKYKCNELAFAFNGGKDSIVVLKLLEIVVNKLKEKHPNDSSLDLGSMLTIYFLLEDSFTEVTDYVWEISKKYKLRTIQLGRFKEGLSKIKVEYPEIKAIFMGTRRNDPHGEKLSDFQMTDPTWPSFMRIHPILDWSYHDVWDFIHFHKLSYCNLYDKGYTSIGEITNTLPNPALEYTDEDGQKKFHPAHKLKDGSLERHGRNSKSN